MTNNGPVHSEREPQAIDQHPDHHAIPDAGTAADVVVAASGGSDPRTEAARRGIGRTIWAALFLGVIEGGALLVLSVFVGGAALLAYAVLVAVNLATVGRQIRGRWDAYMSVLQASVEDSVAIHERRYGPYVRRDEGLAGLALGRVVAHFVGDVVADALPFGPIFELLLDELLAVAANRLRLGLLDRLVEVREDPERQSCRALDRMYRTLEHGAKRKEANAVVASFIAPALGCLLAPALL